MGNWFFIFIYLFCIFWMTLSFRFMIAIVSLAIKFIFSNLAANSLAKILFSHFLSLLVRIEVLSPFWSLYYQ